MSAVRALETTLGHRVPVAAVTANAHAEDRERAIAAGFDEYLGEAYPARDPRTCGRLTGRRARPVMSIGPLAGVSRIPGFSLTFISRSAIGVLSGS